MTTDSTTVRKVSLHGPIPFGGSYHAPADDPKVAQLVARGWTVAREWEVVDLTPPASEADFLLAPCGCPQEAVEQDLHDGCPADIDHLYDAGDDE